ncbi:hypothetical protein GXW77_19900 [Roseomonas alkaliterrae]|uniref:PEP-CTERM protein-sorting domain-containing protein n=1 Tax=Neoroseomonas alkaliterrae TaxID=1452450 RepID=A0A840XX99_9PROT|nr:hypothetical protein [Neoroseomonas alkaliterrae]MBB5688451.1 hypothetical protein [Neoroseomonas alkaliterrae]MBR0678437.1 hypothetical protein [Neoroseomonas alkaliterrae]
MVKWMRAAGAALLALGLALAAPRAADAALVEVTFNASGLWELEPGTVPPPTPPFGTDPNPVLTGTALLDNARSGEDALLAFSMVTGGKTWSLASGLLFFSVEFAGDGSVRDLFIGLGGADGFLILGGEAGSRIGATLSLAQMAGGVGQGMVTLSCNDCLLIESRVLPVPTPAALALFGMGLIGLGAARRLVRRAA